MAARGEERASCFFACKPARRDLGDETKMKAKEHWNSGTSRACKERGGY